MSVIFCSLSSRWNLQLEFLITLDHKLTWSTQIDFTASKMGRGVSVVQRVLKDMPSDVIKQEY